MIMAITTTLETNRGDLKKKQKEKRRHNKLNRNYKTETIAP